MLQIVVPASEQYDSKNNLFYNTNEQTLLLEHSLISLSKWEAKYKRSFLNSGPQNVDEILFYIKCMTINKNVDDLVYNALNKENIEKITDYIDDPMTATTFYDFSNTKGRRKQEIVTAEVIYSWMIILQIPIEFEKWHINRLLTLIRVVNIKSQPDQKMSKAETAAMYRKLNAQRRKARHTKG